MQDLHFKHRYNSETCKRLDSIRDRIKSARRRSARAQTSKLISSRQANMNIHGLQTLLEKSILDLHDLIRTQRNGHGVLSDVFRSRREQAPNQLSIVCKNLRRLVRRLGRMGLSSFKSISEEDDDLERDRPSTRDSAKILGKLKRDLVSDVASRRRAIDIATKRLRARDIAEMKAYEVTRDEIRALRNARDLEAAYTQRLARRLENATKDPVSCTSCPRTSLFINTHLLKYRYLRVHTCDRTSHGKAR